MNPRPVIENPEYRPAGHLKDKVVLITGGDSGIGAAVAIACALEGADVAVNYLEEGDDAKRTLHRIREIGREALDVRGDISKESVCIKIVKDTVQKFGQLDVLINNAAEQHPQKSIKGISTEQFEQTFATNVFSHFHLVKAALPHLSEGSAIINTASVVAFRGQPELLDYSATKGAVLAFTRSLSLMLAKKKIRVNAVAPGPIWTPLIPSTFSPEKVAEFGSDTPMGRAGQPFEVAPAFVFLASDDASYISGQTIHVNGGEVVNA